MDDILSCSEQHVWPLPPLFIFTSYVLGWLETSPKSPEILQPSENLMLPCADLTG